jgi:hypothetical protein
VAKRRELEVNGMKYPIHSDANTPLLVVLREEIGLNGHAVRLRRGTVWSVHRTDRRVAPAFVPSAGGGGHALNRGCLYLELAIDNATPDG